MYVLIILENNQICEITLYKHVGYIGFGLVVHFLTTENLRDGLAISQASQIQMTKKACMQVNFE